MTDLKVAVWPSDTGACGHLRLIWPAHALAGTAGITVDVDPPPLQVIWDRPWDSHPEPPPNVHPVDVRPPDADVVVMQRPLSRWRCELIPLLQAHGVAVVVEVDDDFATVAYRNPAWPTTDPHWFSDLEYRAAKGLGHEADRTGTWPPGGTWWHVPGCESQSSAANLARACRFADLVTVTTAALAGRYGRHGRCHVLPNLAPRSWLDLPPAVFGDVVGWAGSMLTHQGDLAVMHRALTRVGGRFHVVGTGAGVARETGRPPEAVTGSLTLDAYIEAVGLMSVALAPLAETPFNRAKSWLKGLEAAARGVPWVGSPLPEYVSLHKRGCGVLAARPREWASAVNRLLSDRAWWEDRAAAGRDVAEGLTVEDGAWRWAEAWCQAALNRTEAMAA